MQRRSFLKFVGLAMGGLAITPKIELLNKLGTEEDKLTISFQLLEETYRRACKGSIEPNLLLVSKDTYEKILEFIKPQMRFSNHDINTYTKEVGFSNFKFHNAYVTFGDTTKDGDFNQLVGMKYKLDTRTKIIVGIQNPPNIDFYKDFI